MAEVEIPGELILPPPKDDKERQLFLALEEQNRQIINALTKISELLP